ncbi:MAG: polyketide synthase dehydratase domain-containing protein [Syntrophales bacterium]|nr:polyketide synthase dehydratase domain-containing protein [Syntrophales bacterium]
MVAMPPPSEVIPNGWRRFPCSISVLPYLQDHHVAGKTIFPAAEILQHLGGTVANVRPEFCVTVMGQAAFGRFLEIGPDDDEIRVFHDVKVIENSRISARLVTVAPSGRSAIRREKIHAIVDFPGSTEHEAAFPYDLSASLEGICFRVSAEKIYRDLIPFGPAFHSLQGDVFLTEGGGLGRVLAAPHPAPLTPLGSIFPFDGAMHVACAWSQRFHGIVAFPIGFNERRVMNPTVQGETYCCRILPVRVTPENFIFDMIIADERGNLRESIRGLTMKDVFVGRGKPPSWIRQDRGDPLPTLRANCHALAVMEDDAFFDFAELALTPVESERFAKMGRRRQRGYLMGRLALKALARELAGGERLTPAQDIHTMMPDGIRPCCPHPSGQTPVSCSLSHDRRFAVAAVSDEPIGVDVEVLSERVLKARHLFMNDQESRLTDASSLGVMPAALRVWSIKESVTKAINIPIGDCWQRTDVLEIGEHVSHLKVDGRDYIAFHDTVDDHLFTLVKRAP